MTYREFQAAPALAGVVEAVWTRSVPVGPAGTGRIVPDGCTDLMWVDGELLVAGPDTRAHQTAFAGGSAYVAVRFAPGAGPTVLGVPASELRDARVPLDALWPAREVRRIAGLVGGAADGAGGDGVAGRRRVALQAAVLDRLGRTGPPDPLAAAVAAGQRAGAGVAATAAALGLSERQLHRRCLAAFGYGPKTLGRILRFRRATALARAGAGFAEVAAGTGYADQAHLAREVRALSGVTLGELLA